jgi:transposase InsO family protein
MLLAVVLMVLVVFMQSSTLGMGVHVSERLVAVLMSMNRIAHLASVGKVKRLRGVVTADNLVNRKFHRPHPNELWVTDITEDPTREGKVYCCAVLDAFSGKNYWLVN